VLEVLGEGGAAVVKKCMRRDNNQLFAVKIMRNYDSEKEMASRAEYELLKSIPNHPNIVYAEEFIITERWTYTVMEYASGTELSKLERPQDYVKTVMQ
jgi:serine/threonine protein kinase